MSDLLKSTLAPEGDSRPRARSRLSLRRDSLRGHQNDSESQVYTSWLNWKTRLSGAQLPPVQNLATDLKNGSHLAAICKLFTGKDLRMPKKFSSKFQYIENIEKILKTFERQDWPADVSPNAFVEGDTDAILGYLWRVIMCEQKMGHRDSVIDGGGTREIWKWAERFLDGDHPDVYPGRLSNGREEFQDGAVLSYLIRKAFPESLDLDSRPQFSSAEAWIEHVLSVAEENGVPRLINAHHLIDEKKNDKLSKPLATYLFAFREVVEPSVSLVTAEHFQRDAEEFRLYLESDLAEVVDGARKIKNLQDTWEACGRQGMTPGHTYADAQDWMTRFAEEEAARGFQEKERRRLLREQLRQQEEAVRSARELELQQADEARRLREQQEVELEALEEARRLKAAQEAEARRLLEGQLVAERELAELEEEAEIERRRLAEARLLEAERRRLAEARLLEEARQREEEQRLQEERQELEMERRRLAEARRLEEARLREEQKLQEERQELEVERQRLAEARLLEEARLREEQKLQEELEAERQRLAEEEKQRDLEEQEGRVQAERLAMEQQLAERDRMLQEERDRLREMRAMLEDKERQLAEQRSNVDAVSPIDAIRAALAEEREASERRRLEHERQMDDKMERFMEKMDERLAVHQVEAGPLVVAKPLHQQQQQQQQQQQKDLAKPSATETLLRRLAEVEREIVRAKNNMKEVPKMVKKIRECPGDGAVQISASLEHDSMRLHNKLHRINASKASLLDAIQMNPDLDPSHHKRTMRKILKQMRNFVEDYGEVMENVRDAQPHLQDKKDRYKRQRTHLWIHRSGNPIPQHIMVTTNKPSSMNYRRHVSIDARKEFYAPIKNSQSSTKDYVNSLFSMTHELADQREMYEPGEDSLDSSALIEAPDIFQSDGSLFFPPGDFILEGKLVSHDHRYYCFLFSSAFLCTRQLKNGNYELAQKIGLDSRSIVGPFEKSDVSFLVAGRGNKQRVFTCESREVANSWISHLNAALNIIRGEEI